MSTSTAVGSSNVTHTPALDSNNDPSNVQSSAPLYRPVSPSSFIFHCAVLTPSIKLSDSALRYDFRAHERTQVALATCASVELVFVRVTIQQLSVSPMALEERIPAYPMRFGLCSRIVPILDSNKCSNLHNFPFFENHLLAPFHATQRVVSWCARDYSYPGAQPFPPGLQLSLLAGELTFGYATFVMGKAFGDGDSPIVHAQIDFDIRCTVGGAHNPSTNLAPNQSAL